ncbi:MAG: hypothetical protein RIC19_11670 [Phaeodactylibacter sp.]|uniref:hypothetical protein n=1 Tax=Phaeodactylibacter sp. TaxID=1940289 RepID=UPI0032EBD762
MKLLKPIVLLFVLVAGWSACSTEVNLEAEWKDIPIVYGFLNVQDSAHYIRVQKAFLEPGGDALQVAQINDSIYYSDVAVTLENRTKGTSFVLERVNGEEEGYDKEEGVFSNSPNILYKISAEEADLEGGNEVFLRVDRGDELPPATATTIVLSPIDSVSSSPSNNINTWRYNQLLPVSWRPGPEALIFDVRFIIHYREVIPGQMEEPVAKTLEWVVNKSVLRDNPDGEREKVDISGQSFFAFLGSAIPPSQGEVRVFDFIDIVITGAGEEFRDFVLVEQANTGITSAQNIPIYTNVEEGLGVFTSRYQLVRRGVRLGGEARDTLENGIFTRDINFN